MAIVQAPANQTEFLCGVSCSLQDSIASAVEANYVHSLKLSHRSTANQFLSHAT